MDHILKRIVDHLKYDGDPTNFTVWRDKEGRLYVEHRKEKWLCETTVRRGMVHTLGGSRKFHRNLWLQHFGSKRNHR